RGRRIRYTSCVAHCCSIVCPVAVIWHCPDILARRRTRGGGDCRFSGSSDWGPHSAANLAGCGAPPYHCCRRHQPVPSTKILGPRRNRSLQLWTHSNLADLAAHHCRASNTRRGPRRVLPPIKALQLSG